jgi:hypothetical protein
MVHNKDKSVLFDAVECTMINAINIPAGRKYAPAVLVLISVCKSIIFSVISQHLLKELHYNIQTHFVIMYSILWLYFKVPYGNNRPMSQVLILKLVYFRKLQQ